MRGIFVAVWIPAADAKTSNTPGSIGTAANRLTRPPCRGKEDSVIDRPSDLAGSSRNYYGFRPGNLMNQRMQRPDRGLAVLDGDKEIYRMRRQHVFVGDDAVTLQNLHRLEWQV